MMKPSRSRLFPTLVFVLLSLTAVGCGSTPGSPAAPSDLSGSSSASSAVLTFGGGSASSAPTIDSASDPKNTEVEGEGKVTSLVAGSSCPTLQFKLEGHTIKTSAATTYEGGACVDIKVGASLEVKGTKDAEGTILASRVKFKHKEKKKVRGDGEVTSLVASTACPTLQFVIGEHKISTDGSTKYEGGVCADVKVGVKVDVEGTEQAEHDILASVVRLKGKPKEKEKVEGEGRITVIDAVARTIKVEEFTIIVPPTAKIRQGDKPLTFEDLKVGYRVHVRALRGEDGITAEEVVVQETHRKFVEGEARVTELVDGTSCPTLQFKVKDFTVGTDAATLYTGGVCADIKVGTRVQVKGTIQDDGTVLAQRVQIKAKGVGGESTVSSLLAGTACPTLQFIVASVTVHTDADTEYKGGVCTDIKVGTRVEVKGSHEADGVHATKVEIKN